MIFAVDTPCFATTPFAMAAVARSLPQFNHLSDAAIRSWFQERALLLAPRDRRRDWRHQTIEGQLELRASEVFESRWEGKPFHDHWNRHLSDPCVRVYRSPMVCQCPPASHAHLSRTGCPFTRLRWRYLGGEVLRLATRVGAKCAACGSLFRNLEVTDERTRFSRHDADVEPRDTPIRARFFSFVWGDWNCKKSGLPEFCDSCVESLGIPLVDARDVERAGPAYAFRIFESVLPDIAAKAMAHREGAA